jgi:hypothetical protein
MFPLFPLYALYALFPLLPLFALYDRYPLFPLFSFVARLSQSTDTRVLSRPVGACFRLSQYIAYPNTLPIPIRCLSLCMQSRLRSMSSCLVGYTYLRNVIQTIKICTQWPLH